MNDLEKVMLEETINKKKLTRVVAKIVYSAQDYYRYDVYAMIEYTEWSGRVFVNYCGENLELDIVEL
jgi:hypothetical protein